jgi:hypothetical protein
MPKQARFNHGTKGRNGGMWGVHYAPTAYSYNGQEARRGFTPQNARNARASLARWGINEVRGHGRANNGTRFNRLAAARVRANPNAYTGSTTRRRRR